MRIIPIVLASLVACSLAMWVGQKELDSHPKYMMIVSVFTSPAGSHYTHILYRKYINSDVSNLYHMAFDPAQTVVIEPHLLETKVGMAKIEGSENGKHLFVVYETYNGLGNPRQIFFIESLDGGISWTNPAEIGQDKNVKDRYAPNVMYQRNTGRITVFFISYIKDNTAVTMATRPKGSVVFTPERYLFNTKNQDFELELAYTREGKHGSVIHLQWGDPVDDPTKSSIYYMRSEDNGITWSEPISLYAEKVNIFISLEASHLPETPVLATTATDIWKSYLRVSSNSGRSWDNEIPFKSHINADLKVCGDGTLKNTMIFISGQDLSFEPKFSYMGALDKTVAEGEAPFYKDSTHKYNTKIFLSCFMESKDVALVIASTVEDRDRTEDGHILLTNYGRYNISGKVWETVE